MEIDLLRIISSTVTIRRTISAENKGSKWFINGQLSTFAAVKAIMCELAIDVDNLCSFMPQDRVGEFTRNSPKQILEQTLALIADPNDNEGHTLADEQKELANFEMSKLEKDKEVEARRGQLETHQQQLNGMKGEVQLMEARKNAQDKKQLCDLLFQNQLVKDGKDKLKVLDVEVQTATTALTKAEDTIAPLKEAERTLQVNPLPNLTLHSS